MHSSPSSPSETDIIQHIKFIAQDLFVNSQPPKKHNYSQYSPFSTLTKTVSGGPTPSDSIKQCHCYHQIKHRMKILQSEPSQKQARLSIFQKFEKYWSETHKNAQHKDATPIMQRINKNIYSRFKTNYKELRKLTDPQKKTKEESEEIWNEFLNRENRWIDQKKKVIRQTQLADQARLQSMSSQKYKKRVSLSPQKILTAQWSLIHEGIRELKTQTERLRAHILQLNQQQKKNPKLLKTFQSKRR